jgi:acyl-CoA reductase-like NAD-dependent aldehyde dehydrogenase
VNKTLSHPVIHRGLFVDGAFPEPSATLKIYNPFDGQLVGTVAEASPPELDRIVESSVNGFRTWSRMPAHARAQILMAAADALEARAEDVAQTITAELGKPIRDSRLESSRSPKVLRRAAEEAKRFHGDIVQMDATPGAENRFGFTMRVPLGPIACITPFNFPMSAVLHKIAPALAAGNSAIVKPASATPLTALLIAEVMHQAGLPDGVLNVATGSGETVGGPLVRDPRVRMVAFTGSAAVGMHLQADAGFRRVQLELGSNGAMIVHDDADLAAAATIAVRQGFNSAGQVCIAIQRVYVQRRVYDEVVERVVTATNKLKVGDPWDEATDVGPLVSVAAAARTQSWVDEAAAGGAQVLTGGTSDGAVYAPTVIVGASPDMKVVCREIFAPVIVVESYDKFDQALDAANRSDYGLQAGVFTRDLYLAFRAAQRLDVGAVMVNDGPRFRVDYMPYGGMKMSGIGREGVRYAMDEMSDVKTIVINEVFSSD